MYISITSSKTSDEHASKVEAFLKTFLPHMRQAPGVVAIYRYARPDKGDKFTIVIWESEAALNAYRQSDLAKEAVAFEQSVDLPGRREAYPLLQSL